MHDGGAGTDGVGPGEAGRIDVTFIRGPQGAADQEGGADRRPGDAGDDADAGRDDTPAGGADPFSPLPVGEPPHPRQRAAGGVDPCPLSLPAGVLEALPAVKT